MLSAQPPYTGPNGYAVIRSKIEQDAPRLETVRPGTPPALAGLVAELLERDPGNRPATAREVHERLASLREPQVHALDGAGRAGPPSVHQWVPSTGAALPYPVPAPSSSPAATAPPPAAMLPPVPAQLPADVAHFTGRDGQLEALTALAADAGSAVVITAIGGTAGIGKTALAVHWAHRAAASFPDGQLYVNLRGFDPAGTPLPPEAAVRGFLDALAVPPERIPADPGARASLYRSLLAGQRMLVVLDNARDPAQVRPLLPGSPGCLVLVTSRSQLTGLAAVDGARTLTLDLLTPQEARDLLARRLGTERVTAEPAAAGELTELCARLPLALNITAARAAARPAFPLAVFATQLRQARDRLTALDAGGDVTADVRGVFSWSYRALSPAAARTFRLLGIHPGPDITPPATASLTAVSRDQASATLDELAAACLLTEHAPGRYTFHDLLRAYAADQARTHDTDEEQHQALHRLLDHYLHTAYAADRLVHPLRDPITLAPPRPGTVPEELADDQQAWHWLRISGPPRSHHASRRPRL